MDQVALHGRFSEYSASFAELVGRTLECQGRAVIIELHSYPATPLPYELHADEGRPELCLGVDEFHTPVGLQEAVREAFAGFEVAVNEPFHGAYVPLRFYRRDPRVQSVMLEIRRDRYLDQGEPIEEGVASLASGLGRFVELISVGPRGRAVGRVTLNLGSGEK